MSLNQVPSKVNLKDFGDLLMKQIMLGMNCHAIGRIESFSAEEQTAKVSIAYKKAFQRPGPTGVYRTELQGYPVLVDSPVIFLGGGNGALTFPVAEGDECLVLFNDRDMDAWFQGNYGAQNPTARLHSFADGVILVGLRSRPNVIASFVDDRTELRTLDGRVKVSLGDEDIHLDIYDGEGVPLIALTLDSDGKLSAVNAQGELISALDALFTALQSATAGGYPLLVPPDYASNLAILQSFKV